MTTSFYSFNSVLSPIPHNSSMSLKASSDDLMYHVLDNKLYKINKSSSSFEEIHALSSHHTFRVKSSDGKILVSGADSGYINSFSNMNTLRTNLTVYAFNYQATSISVIDNLRIT